MVLLMLVPPDFDSVGLIAQFPGYGVHPTCRPLEGSSFAVDAAQFDGAVLVWPRTGIIALGEKVTHLRQVIGPDKPLIVCAQRPSPDERRLIADCGATAMLTPRNWAPAATAERILAQLMVDRRIEPTSHGTLRGGAQVMRDVYREIETFAHLSDPVLIVGETGTGKELVAQELHRRSARGRDLMALNCANLSKELMGSELFGHSRGAFTGADSVRSGLLVTAGGGSVFLDELPELTLGAQAELLRVIEERKVRPVGDNRWIPLGARLIFGANQDLQHAVNDGRFRQDLFERVRGFTVFLPPLRERRLDIPLLAEHFLGEYDAEYAGRRRFPQGALDGLFRHDWPGNVRELRQVVRVAAAHASPNHGEIDPRHLEQALHRRPKGTPRGQISFDPSVDSWRAVFDRARTAYVHAVLESVDGNRDRAAKRAGLSRSQFYEILRQIENNVVPEEE